MVRVVQQEDVARMDAAGEGVAHRGHRPRDGAHVDRHVLGLGHQARLVVADGRGEVAAGVEDLRVGGAQHRLAHLLHDRLEPMGKHRHRDGIDHGGSIRRTRRDDYQWKPTPTLRWCEVRSERSRAVSMNGPPPMVPGTRKSNVNGWLWRNLYSANTATLRVTNTRIPARTWRAGCTLVSEIALLTSNGVVVVDSSAISTARPTPR